MQESTFHPLLHRFCFLHLPITQHLPITVPPLQHPTGSLAEGRTSLKNKTYGKKLEAGTCKQKEHCPRKTSRQEEPVE